MNQALIIVVSKLKDHVLLLVGHEWHLMDHLDHPAGLDLCCSIRNPRFSAFKRIRRSIY